MIHWITPESEIIEDEGDFLVNFTIKLQDGRFMLALLILNYGILLVL